MTARSGFVWAGYHELWMTSDLGTTWQKRSPNLAVDEIIRDVKFLDANAGIIGTAGGTAYLTTDQGQTWSQVRKVTDITAVDFLGSPNDIIVSEGIGNNQAAVEISSDGGKAWQTSVFNGLAWDVHSTGPGKAYVLVGDARIPLTMWSTTDYGKSWQQQAGIVGYDTYSFAAEPCSIGRLIVTKEGFGGVPPGAQSEIYVSSNGGQTFAITYQHPIRSLCGSCVATPNVTYAQTATEGVIRTIDHGASWNQITGPSAPYDTRLIAVVDDNTVLAADDEGSIWVTGNSGGNPITIGVNWSPFSYSPPAGLFTTVSLLPCDQPVEETTKLTGNFCTQPIVISMKIVGDEFDYKITSAIPNKLDGDDDVTIQFKPTQSGPRHGWLEIMFDDNSVYRVPLSGEGKGTGFLALASYETRVDTIGAATRIPIKAIGLPDVPGFKLTIKYDPLQLRYKSTVDVTGASLDVSSTNGSSTIHIAKGLVPADGVIAWTTFDVFPDGREKSVVTFGDITIDDDVSPCAFSSGPASQAIVNLPTGCGVNLIGKMMRDGNLFPFEWRVEQDRLLIESQQPVSITLTNSLGHIVAASNEKEISLTGLASGAYFLTVGTQGLKRRFSFIRTN